MSDSGNGRLVSLCLMSVLMLTLMATMMPVAYAQRVINNGGAAIIGETSLNLTIVCNGTAPTTLIGIAGDADGEAISVSDPADFDSSVVAGFKEGVYKCNWTGNETTGWRGTMSFTAPSLVAKTTSNETGHKGEEITSVAQGDNIVLNATTNLEIIGGVQIEYKLDGYTEVGGVALKGVTVTVDANGLDSVNIDTDDLDVATYTLSIATNSSQTFNGTNSIDAEGPSVTFDVAEPGLSTFTADKTSVAVGGKITFSGSTTPFTNVSLTVGYGTATAVWWQGGMGEVTSDVRGDNIAYIITKNDGTFSATANFTTDGSYKIRAALTETPTEYLDITILVLSGGVDYAITLTPGWNLFSIPDYIDSNSVAETLSGVSYDAIYTYNDGAWEVPTSFEPLHAYWINATADNQFINLSWKSDWPIVRVPPSRTMEEGWQLISPNFGENDDVSSLSANEVLISIDGSYSTLISYDAGTMGTYTVGDSAISSLDLIKGHGYWLFMTQRDTMAGR